jgi:predicted MFS family arabinose efflux permease
MSAHSPAAPRPSKVSEPFTRYEKFLVALIAFLNFTVILDFMILSPLGAMLIPQLHVTTEQFGEVVSGYAIAAGISGLLAAGFADRFDRKHLLMFFYTGFIAGTLLCALATSYQFLLLARIVTGLFGGVVGSVGMAIVADMFALHRRGRVMGLIQTAFAGAQVLGLPIGLYLANHFGWHSGFYFIVLIGVAVAVVIAVYLRPVDLHLASGHKRHPAKHLWLTATNRRYVVGFAATMLLSTGGFMLMPFASTFSVNNLGLTFEQLPMIYLITGCFTIVTGPLLGKLSDSVGKYSLFLIATLVGIGLVLFYTRLGTTPMWEVVAINVVLFATISARMISAGALTSAVSGLADRGAYMAISNSMAQLAGGVASWIAGKIVVQSASGTLEHYPLLGAVVAGAMLVSAAMLYQVHCLVRDKLSKHPAAAGAAAA